MTKCSLPTGLVAAAGMLVLIVDSRTALEAARESVQFVTQTVVPSLFPFFFLSGWLMSSDINGFPGGACMARIFRIPDTCSYLLLPAFLGGYPTGAQAIASAHQRGQLSKESAQRLLGYCSNAGPSFLFGVVASCFSTGWMCWVLWILHIAGALAAAWMLPAVTEECTAPSERNQKPSMSDVLLCSLKTTAIVCGWVILFRILIAFMDRWFLWYFSQPLQVFLKGIIELTNGCFCLGQIQDVRLRFVVCSALLCLGGFCVSLQTKSVVRSLSLRYYCIGKGIQCAFSVTAASAIVYRSFIPLLIPLSFVLLSEMNRKKRSSVPGILGV